LASAPVGGVIGGLVGEPIMKRAYDEHRGQVMEAARRAADLYGKGELQRAEAMRMGAWSG
jgi:hypothetical protein